MPMLDAALAWLDRGFAVFPLKPRGKVPLGSLVPRGFLDASREPDVIRDWWRHEPHANIGIVTGGGHFVVDLDDAEAVSWFSNACGRHGGAPKTLTVRTSRGFHVFFILRRRCSEQCGQDCPRRRCSRRRRLCGRVSFRASQRIGLHDRARPPDRRSAAMACRPRAAGASDGAGVARGSSRRENF
jgi:hypothetical protein